MLRFVVGWLAGAHPSSAIKLELPVARDASAILEFLRRQEALAKAPTPRELGIRFHRDEFTRLFEAAEGWPTVEFITSRGLPIESSTISQRVPTAGSTSLFASWPRLNAVPATSPAGFATCGSASVRVAYG